MMKNDFVVDAMFGDVRFRNVQKMPALFVIDRVRNIATDVVNEAADWVFTDPARVTVKHDGTGITVTDDGRVFARRSVRKGKGAPVGFILAEVDSFTGHAFGMLPVEDSSFAKFFNEAVESFVGPLVPGTYELVGPKINGNPERKDRHELTTHGVELAVGVPDLRSVSREDAYSVLREVFAKFKNDGVEGVVWWGAGGRRVKLRVHDFFGDPNRR